jgi:uncharacterized membrane protein
MNAVVSAKEQKFFGSFFQKRTAFFYFVFATLALLLLAPMMPPFQNADEAAHAFRADQLSHGELLGHGQGGSVDAGLHNEAATFEPIKFHVDRKVTRAMYAPMDWGGHMEAGFSNTAIYPPLFYLPAAAALAVARMMKLSVLHGLILARLASGAVAILAGTLAIALGEDAAVWIFAILLLPMSLSLTASLSQDAPMLAATALAVVVCRRPGTPRALVIATLLFALVAMARPPYAAFALLLLGVQAPLVHRWCAVLLVVTATVCWGLAAAPLMQFTHTATINPAAQMHQLLSAPWQIPALLVATWQTSHVGLLIGFIGSLGWQDVNLPGWYDRAACLMLGVALVVFLTAVKGRDRAMLLVPASIIAACGLVGLAEYLTWSGVGAPRIDGMQGRYFLAPALLIAALPAARRKLPWIDATEAFVWLFPILSIAVTMNAIRVRYYV